MSFQTGIVDFLDQWGLEYTLVDGWATRGDPNFSPRGHVLHHDVIPNTSRTPAIIIHGRSDLAGPLANFWLRPDGHVFVVAAGRANHAGEGGWRGLVGNSSVWGTEMNNLGTPATPWPDAQLDAMVRLAAATADYSNFQAAYVCGHKEWAPTRKIDPHSINMGAFRARVATAEKRGFTIMDQATRDYFDAKFAKINETLDTRIATRRSSRLTNDRLRLLLERVGELLRRP